MPKTIEEKIARTCTSKLRYVTRKQARRKGRMLHLREYRCMICGGFHLTRQKGERFIDPDLV